MKRFILAALAATTLAGPVLAQPNYDRRDDRQELRQDRRELQGDRRELRGDLRRGDYNEYRRDAREFREDRRELGEDRRDFRREYGRGYGDDRRWNGNAYRERFYGYPSGFSYRSYGVGYAVPRAYWNDRYWIARPDYYRLPPAWRGTRWVRVGPDALLIRLADGYVVRAVRSLYFR